MTNPLSNIDVSIIIVNYKSWKHLTNCLNSLDFQSEQYSFEIIVVDNCSNDEQLKDFKENFPLTKFILNSGNNGFANGCNKGANHAIGNYLLFLNPDTIANEEAIFEMWQFAKKNPKVGVVSCEQKKAIGGYEKSIRIFPSLSTLFGFTRAIYKVFNKNKFIDQSVTENHVLYTDWVSGSVVFISKEWFQQIKGWNEDYWMYFEDVDLSKRVHLANGRVALLKNVEIIHNHGGSSRINIKTASITKTEVLISKHVYIKNHFQGYKYFTLQTLLVLNNIVGKLILGILGIILFFIPKLRLGLNLCINIFKYYFVSIKNRTWLSPNSMNR